MAAHHDRSRRRYIRQLAWQQIIFFLRIFLLIELAIVFGTILGLAPATIKVLNYLTLPPLYGLMLGGMFLIDPTPHMVLSESWRRRHIPQAERRLIALILGLPALVLVTWGLFTIR